MMLFGFGRVPGCLGLGALFLWDEWRDERTDSRPAGSLSVLFFGGVRCGGLTGGWWIQWNEVLAVFVEGFLLTFDGGVVILKVHIWEHSGPFGYLIPIWLVV